MEIKKLSFDKCNLACIFLFAGISALPFYTSFKMLTDVFNMPGLGVTPFYVKAFKDITFVMMVASWLLFLPKKILADKLLWCFYFLVACLAYYIPSLIDNYTHHYIRETLYFLKQVAILLLTTYT